jgi:hypothetical protein
MFATKKKMADDQKKKELFGFWVLGFGSWGLGFGVWGLDFGVWG